MLDSAHYFLAPLCSFVVGGPTSPGPAGATGSGPEPTSSAALQGPAHQAALQLACALLAADVVALGVLAGTADSPEAAAQAASDACMACLAGAAAVGGAAEGLVRAAAEVAAASAKSWKVLPALWQVSKQGAQMQRALCMDSRSCQVSCALYA